MAQSLDILYLMFDFLDRKKAGDISGFRNIPLPESLMKLSQTGEFS